MGDLLTIQGNGVTFYIDKRGKIDKIYFCTGLQCMKITYTENRMRSGMKMNRLSLLIQNGNIKTIDQVSSVMGIKLGWQPAYQSTVMQTL